MRCITFVFCMVVGSFFLALPVTAEEFSLHSNSFGNGKTIPMKFVSGDCGGGNKQPHLSWSNAPSGTKYFALLMDDPDAKPIAGYTWVHLNAYNIPLDVLEVSEGTKIQGAKYGKNHNKQKRYTGPCAPRGSHTYIFAVYAMSEKIKLKKAHNRAKFEKVFSEKIVGKAEYTGTWR
ncbi:MAG: YbhB/YbcL family Raf kinase inhibitor-like protein [Rhodospirillaceae bacterium]|nr:YbhB/YbcL family Raf kinase inhibitor-like protein [Rhodospirillaceae bacterium]